MKLYMFLTVPLSIIRSFSLYTQQWYMSYRFADSLRAGSGWNYRLDALISQIYSWNETLHVSDSSSVHHQEFFTVDTAMVYVIEVCWQLASRIRMELPTRCTNFSNLFLEWNSTCFWQFLYPSSEVFHYTYSNGICHTGLLTACEQEHLLGRPARPRLTALLSPSSNGKPEVATVVVVAPDDGHKDARNMLSCI